MSESKDMADIGLIGLAVMGENLVLNMDDHGYRVCVFNRTINKVEDFLKNRAKGTKIIGSYSVEEFVKKLKKPRLVMLLVMAGKPVDDFINKLTPLLEADDVIIDAGNSDFHDTQRRFSELLIKKIRFIGTGVSGGEKGARYGPSIMPGGSIDAWPLIQPIFKSISARVGEDSCVTWIGSDGAGHYVKMVHNGIEYADMQLICEAYHLMKYFLELDSLEISQIFNQWNSGILESYLIEITSNILKFKQNEEFLVDLVRDTAGQKGTGKWTVVDGLDMGVPVTLISEAVFARCLSSLKNDRIKCSQIFKKNDFKFTGDKKKFIEDIKNALLASKIISYSQGFMLLREASFKYNWNLKYGEIAMIWRGGCIIKSRFLTDIFNAFYKNPQLSSLIFDDYFKNLLNNCQESWRNVVSTCVLNGIPAPAFSSSLSFFDGYRSKNLPANLLQAQRDYFGAHTFELESKPGHFIHSSWGQD